MKGPAGILGKARTQVRRSWQHQKIPSSPRQLGRFTLDELLMVLAVVLALAMLGFVVASRLRPP